MYSGVCWVAKQMLQSPSSREREFEAKEHGRGREKGYQEHPETPAVQGNAKERNGSFNYSETFKVA